MTLLKTLVILSLNLGTYKNFIFMNITKLIKKAVKICGSQNNLAKLTGISQVSISKVLKGGGINAKYIQAISDATNNQITVEQLVKALDHRNDNRR